MLECKKNVEIVWLGEKKGGKYVYWQKGGEGARVNVALKKKKKQQIVPEMASYFKINSQIYGADGNLWLEWSSVLLH